MFNEYEYEREYQPPPDDIDCLGDCSECPYFLRIDICGYEVATNLYF